VIDCTGLSVVASAKENLLIYPNPFKNKITIEKTGGAETPLQIYNCLGSVIYSSQINSGTEVDLSAETSGIYFIRIGTITKKIIKE
jgi:hypothetical protein